MPYYAVRSGNIFRCVLADDAKAACVAAATHHCHDEDTDECAPGEIFQVAELGQSYGDNVWILSEHVQETGGFKVVELDAEHVA